MIILFLTLSMSNPVSFTLFDTPTEVILRSVGDGVSPLEHPVKLHSNVIVANSATALLPSLSNPCLILLNIILTLSFN